MTRVVEDAYANYDWEPIGRYVVGAEGIKTYNEWLMDQQVHRIEPPWPGDPELNQRILEHQLKAQTARIDDPPRGEKARRPSGGSKYRAIDDFYTVAGGLGLSDSKAFGRAMDIAERHPDHTPEIAAVYLRALAELVSEARPEAEPSEWAKRKGYYHDDK